MDTSTAVQPILLSAAESAKLLGIGRSLFYSLRSEGKLPRPRQLGGRVLWQKSELEKWIDHNCPTQQQWEQMKKQKI